MIKHVRSNSSSNSSNSSSSNSSSNPSISVCYVMVCDVMLHNAATDQHAKLCKHADCAAASVSLNHENV
jgi:hypothetical protein